MATNMLIDAAHPEETRVVVLRGQRVEEFDYESAHKKQLRGNIYLAKVTRVEPSLQAAFVDYGGNRHGFLAFNEIHPDYYQIPVADRQALLEEDAEEENLARAAEAAEDEAANSGRRRHRSRHGRDRDEPKPTLGADSVESHEKIALHSSGLSSQVSEPAEPPDDDDAEHERESAGDVEVLGEAAVAGSVTDAPSALSDANGNGETSIESVGSEDALEELPDRPRRRRRVYKIQEVIKRRQIILIQVVKEERGNKGAALTTYLSLAGRYTVLMPNTARGGGISRKITTATDRKKLRDIANELEVPDGMGLIIRTAGAQRTKTEIKRDYDYLLRLWENVRDLTLKSTAPALVYEEGSLIKRSIRDLYNKDIDSVLVAGDEAYREAKDFMRMLMPSHAKNVQPHKEPEPIFIRYQVERQLAAMFSPRVTLRSGGYIVINQTEALVSVDVNSGKATREHNIEDTALKTNLEAAEEIARQLRLRDLAGLIVIDFIDMDERRNSRSVERRMKDCLRHDRARIQVGRISHFGLMEMSRQRLRTGMLEGSTSQCQMCQGTGVVRSTESMALDVLRSIEDDLLTQGLADISATTAVDVALYILNQKRPHLRDIEQRYGVNVTIAADAGVHGSNFSLERRARADGAERPTAVLRMDWAHHGEAEEEDAPPADVAIATEGPEAAVETRDDEDQDGDKKRGGRRRRRRRRGGREDMAATDSAQLDAETSSEIGDDVLPLTGDIEDANGAAPLAEKRPRRRGRRGGRRARGRAGEHHVAADGARRDTAYEGGSEPQGDHEGESESTENGAAASASAPTHAEQPSALEITESERLPRSSSDDGGGAPTASSGGGERGNGLAGKAGGRDATASGPESENTSETADEEISPVPGPEEARPRRRGWWQR